MERFSMSWNVCRCKRGSECKVKTLSVDNRKRVGSGAETLHALTSAAKTKCPEWIMRFKMFNQGLFSSSMIKLLSGCVFSLWVGSSRPATKKKRKKKTFARRGSEDEMVEHGQRTDGEWLTHWWWWGHRNAAAEMHVCVQRVPAGGAVGWVGPEASLEPRACRLNGLTLQALSSSAFNKCNGVGLRTHSTPWL